MPAQASTIATVTDLNDRRLQTHRPFSRAAALEMGLTDDSLRTNRYRRLLHGVYVDAATTHSPTVLAAAALVAAPAGSIIAGRTAAQLWGATVPTGTEVTVRIPAQTRMSVRGVRALRRPAVEFTERLGLPVTTPAQTFLDLASDLDLVDLVVAGDSLVASERLHPDRLIEQCRAARCTGARRARRAANLVRAGVDSPPESRLRMLLVLAGLPEPEVNFILYDERGRWRRRHELAYPELKLAIEYDGAHHAPNGDAGGQWAKDLRRREDMDAEGWRLIVVVRDDLTRSPELILQRVCQALASRGVRASVRSQEWRRFFRPWQ